MTNHCVKCNLRCLRMRNFDACALEETSFIQSNGPILMARGKWLLNQ